MTTDVYRTRSSGELDEFGQTRYKSDHNPVPMLFKVMNCIKLRQISPVKFPSWSSSAYPNLQCHRHLHQNTLADDRSHLRSISAKAERIIGAYSIEFERIPLFFLHPQIFMQFPKPYLHIRRGKSKLSWMKWIYYQLSDTNSSIKTLLMI